MIIAISMLASRFTSGSLSYHLLSFCYFFMSLPVLILPSWFFCSSFPISFFVIRAFKEISFFFFWFLFWGSTLLFCFLVLFTPSASSGCQAAMKFPESVLMMFHTFVTSLSSFWRSFSPLEAVHHVSYGLLIFAFLLIVNVSFCVQTKHLLLVGTAVFLGE